jgi:hypothetical protein
MKAIGFIILLCIVLLMISFKKEKYMNEDVVFYPSNIRTRDYQDLIAITESQIIKTT